MCENHGNKCISEKDLSNSTKKTKKQIAWPQLTPAHISPNYRSMICVDFYVTTVGSGAVLLVCHYVFPGECPSSSLFVLSESEWGPMGAPGWGPFTVPVPSLSYSPGGCKTQTEPTRQMYTRYSFLLYRRSPLTYWVFIYLLRTSLVCECSHSAPLPSLCPTLLRALSRPIYCLVHGFLKQNVNMWHDHHGWPPTALCECGFIFILDVK